MALSHVVQFSTGAGSAEVLYRVVEQYPNDPVIALTANTKAEDYDNWRFSHEVMLQLPEVEWVILSDGRTPMQLGRSLRCVPNDRMAVCSRVLKRELLRNYIERRFPPRECVIYLGFDWTEEHRLRNSIIPWTPYNIAAPLMEPPYLTKSQILQAMRDRGIEPPRLYAQGFSHANCGGGCVRGGQAQWALLLKTNRDRYLEWEMEERATQKFLGKNYTILRRQRNGIKHNLSLRQFREELEDTECKSSYDVNDWGACGCFMGED